MTASHAYADSLSDLQLLEMVGNPTAVYPEEKLANEARLRGWAIYPK
jgi:phosphoserine phosphatase